MYKATTFTYVTFMALLNSDKYTSTMKVTYVNVVALYIPLASSGEQITAVGADRQPVKVEAL